MAPHDPGVDEAVEAGLEDVRRDAEPALEVAVAASVGVIASGLQTDGPGWRWVFFINIPVGLVLISLAMVFLAAVVFPHPTRPADGGAALNVSA